MTVAQKIRKNISRVIGKQPKESPVAYDLWAPSYDHQPKNLMLYLDNELFKSFIDKTDARNKAVLDIGCGTGRHWAHLYAVNPAQVTGYDVSAGMLTELKKKYPAANVHLAKNDLLAEVADHSIDIIISTLTIAHIKNIEEALQAWSRVLKPGGDIFISDYHPILLGNGGKRDFSHNNKHVVIKNYVHSIEKLKAIAAENGMHIIELRERIIDESVKEFYVTQNALPVYEKYKGTPVIYGLRLKKS